MSLIHSQQKPGPPRSFIRTFSRTALKTSDDAFISGNKSEFISIMFSCLCKRIVFVCVWENTVLGSSSCMLSWRATRSERVSTTAASRSKASWGGRQTDVCLVVCLQSQCAVPDTWGPRCGLYFVSTMFRFTQIFRRLRRPWKERKCVTFGISEVLINEMNWYRQGLQSVFLLSALLSFWRCENQALDSSFAAFTGHEAVDYSWNDDTTREELMVHKSQITQIFIFPISAAFWMEALNLGENGVYLNYSPPLISLNNFNIELIDFYLFWPRWNINPH